MLYCEPTPATIQQNYRFPVNLLSKTVITDPLLFYQSRYHATNGYKLSLCQKFLEVCNYI